MTSSGMLSKVPQVTLAFWVIKILATTLGETGGDALSMTLDLGYAISTAIFLRHFCRHLRGANRVLKVAPLSLRVRHRGDNNGRNNNVRLSDAHRRPRLSVAKMIIGG